MQAFVIDGLVVVEPDLGHSDRVLADHVDTGQPLVGRSISEYVADMTARHGEQSAATHPYTEGDLEVLAAPDVHLGIVRAQALEIGLRDGEQAAGHGRRRHRTVVGLALAVLGLGQAVPRELHVPVEAAHAHAATRRVLELERVLVDDVYDGRDHGGLARADLVQERLGPAPGRLDVRVQENEHLALGLARTEQSRSDQTLTLLVAQRADFGAKVLLQIQVKRLQEKIFCNRILNQYTSRNKNENSFFFRQNITKVRKVIDEKDLFE